jgi:hypothetical protein
VSNAQARAGLLGTLLLVAAATPAFAQLKPIQFPDTPVGTTSTIKCPTSTVSLCFGANCSESSTVQSVTGPSAPFAVGKFNRLSNSEFFGGNCEAHPVTLPVTLGPGQILGYQATFAPTAPGTFESSVTFNTAGGPATISLIGTATAAGPTQGLGLVTLTVTPELAVPGNRVEASYEIRRESLTGPTDLYAVVVVPSGDLFFLTETGVSTEALPLRRNVPAVDDTVRLFELFPVDAPFGTYTFFLALARAGQAPPIDRLASPIASATVTFAPLSAVQQATLQQRGNPDNYAMSWIEQAHEKREVWLYAGQPAQFTFVNGALQSATTPPAPPGGALKVNPALFTPQTSLAQLIASFGQPTSHSTFEDAELVSFAGGVEVMFRDGRLSLVNTATP